MDKTYASTVAYTDTASSIRNEIGKSGYTNGINPLYLPTVSLTVNGQSTLAITRGDAYTLEWNSSAQSSCTISYEPNGGSFSVIPNAPGSGTSGFIGTYTMTCIALDGASFSKTLTIKEVPPPPTNLTASCPAPGTYAYMGWSPSPGATSYNVRVNVGAALCPADQGWSTYTNPDGTHNCYVDNYNGLACGGTASNPKSCIPLTLGSYTSWVHASNSSGMSGESPRVSFACTSQNAPTATLTANGQTNLTINPGDTITYAWGSTNGVSSSASFTTDTPACGATTNGPFNWTLPQGLSGSTPFTPGSCSNGHTYTFTYTAVNESGQSASAKLIVHIASNVTAAPTATLTSNGQNIISVSDSDTVFFNWSSTNGANASLSYTVDDGPSYPVDYWYDFNVNPLSGATTAVFSGAAGQKRVYTYTVTGANGQTASSNLTAYINGGPAASAANPYANLANILSAIQAILEKMRGGQ